MSSSFAGFFLYNLHNVSAKKQKAVTKYQMHFVTATFTKLDYFTEYGFFASVDFEIVTFVRS